MKIASSVVNMAAHSTSSQTETKHTTLQYWVGNRSNAVIRQFQGKDADGVDISALAQKLNLQAIEDPKAQAAQAQSAEDGGSEPAMVSLNDLDQQKLKIIDSFVYRLTGKHIKFSYLDEESMKKMRRIGGTVQLTAVQLQPQPQPSAGYGLMLDSSAVYMEKQAMSFSADGTVVTGDGRTVDFSVTLRMSREFQSSAELHVRAGDAKMDPLVINLSGAAPELTERNFSFDIDMDGSDEQISKLMAGSGFLALDKNGDGIVNDGGELFGPTMGNGFAELKTYDADGNGWIDENDLIYDKLRIWMADGQGNMQLIALGQAGVGALYLGNVASAFDIKDAANNSLGSVQSTGVFLKDDGTAGTIQHIDLTV